MKSHIDIKIDGKYLTLPDDFKLNIEERNPLFNDTEMFSYPVEIPMEGNRNLLKNIDDVNSDLRPVDSDFIDGKDAEIHVDGIPFRVGTAIVSEDDEMKDKLSLNIDAADRSFSDLISNLKCRDIPLKDDIVIGEKIGGISINSYLKMQYGVLREDLVCVGTGKSFANIIPYYASQPCTKKTYQNPVDTKYAVDLSEEIPMQDPKKVDLEITPQALGFSYPGLCEELTNHEAKVETGKVISYSAQGKTYNVNKPTVKRSFINISQEYGSTLPAGTSEGGSMNTKGETIPWYYCNSRVCYTHYDEEKQDEKITGTDDYKYETSSNTVAKEAIGSSPEAKWPYWVLDADRQQSGICFYVLYFLDCLFNSLGVEFDKSQLLQIEDFKHLCFFTTRCKYKEENYYDADGNIDTNYQLKDIALVNKWTESRGSGGSLTVTIDPNDKVVSNVPTSYFQMYLTYDMFNGGDTLSDGIYAGSVLSYEDQSVITPGRVEKQVAHSVFERYTPYDQTLTTNIVKMVATSDNFPDENVSTIISSLEASFGIKFYYDYEQHKVTAYLKRSIFRNQESVLTLNGQLIQTYKLSEKITGYRMKYSAESDSKEQRDDVRNSIKDYDTSYDYIDYPQDRCITDEIYADFFRSAIQPSNLHVYIDQNTGNRYRVKVSSEAKGVSDLAPVLFEVAQFKGVEYGDCSDKNSDYVKEDVSSFQPVDFNDVNYQQELASSRQNGVMSASQIYAAFVDDDMEHEFITQEVDNIASNEGVQLLLKETLNLIESYDPSNQDDGNSPLQSHDWGLAIAMLRGGGADSTIQQFDSGYDGFGNSKWRFTGGQYVMHPDTMDAVGNLFDYNGNTSGIGGGERFSLKIRSWVQPDWASAPLCVQDINNTEAKIRTRGLFDTFMKEWAYFLVHRKKYRSKMLIEAAQLSDIKNHWMSLWDINGKLAYIDKISYGISVGNGVEEVTVDYYAI